jgi:hypothetical protein
MGCRLGSAGDVAEEGERGVPGGQLTPRGAGHEVGVAVDGRRRNRLRHEVAGARWDKRSAVGRCSVARRALRPSTTDAT